MREEDAKPLQTVSVPDLMALIGGECGKGRLTNIALKGNVNRIDYLAVARLKEIDLRA